MIFDALYESAKKGELTLVQGGMCRWHLCKNGQLTIYEIISIERGAGQRILDKLKAVPRATSIFAKCPASLASNIWYGSCGFILERCEQTKSGKAINVWRLSLI